MGAPYKTSSPLIAFPAGAPGVTVPPSWVSEGWSNWFPFSTTAPSDMRVVMIYAYPTDPVTVIGNFYECEIGVGSLGNEVPVAAIRGYSGNAAGTRCDLSDGIAVAIPADVI